jgi:hypothetical protein
LPSFFGGTNALPIGLDGYTNRFFVRTIHYGLAALPRTGIQTFDPFGFESFYPTIDAWTGHFRLFSYANGAQSFRFEQYGTTTHAETMALSIPKAEYESFSIRFF